MKQFFFSLKASYLFFALLAVILGTGSAMASRECYKVIFRKINATHLAHCLSDIVGNPVLLAWMVLFFLVGAGLFLNTACCTFSQLKILRRFKRHEGEKRRKSVQMSLIHITALMVLILHALDMTLIERHDPVKLYPGQTAVMGQYTVTVKQVSFVGDPSLIREGANGKKKKSFAIPTKKYSKQKNLALVQITKTAGTRAGKAQNDALAKPLRMMSPVRVGADYFFLAGFFMEPASDRISVKIHHSVNPLVMIFFIVYSLLFCLLIIRYVTSIKEIASMEERS